MKLTQKRQRDEMEAKIVFRHGGEDSGAEERIFGAVVDGESSQIVKLI